MLVLDRDGSVLSSSKEQPAPRPRHGFAELAVESERDLAGRLRRLVELAFDQLGLSSLELHVRDDEQRSRFHVELLPEDLDPFPAQLALEYGLDRF
ncbi:MAG: hypothetical protein KatS3mg057_1005 [Herpetosiphonaceae bacterium]|nr:MAG: hypothetical protein KatS3mg057_1005 [Herpetosiphonaceae bacterium]